MAAPTINANLTNLTTADATTGFAGFNDGGGGTPSVTLSTTIFIEGTGSVSSKLSGSGVNKGFWYDNTSTIDFTVTGRHLYIWWQYTTVSFLDTWANGGVYVRVASDASGNNWSKWWITGGDVYPGGWVRSVLDLNKTPSETAATAATISGLRWFGVGVRATGNANSENLFIDSIDYGTGLQIEAGDSTNPATWQALADDDSSNGYGVIEEVDGVFFVQGGVEIGDASGTATTLWKDASGALVRFKNLLYDTNGLGQQSIIDAPNLYKITAQGNATGTTDIDFGVVVGSGDDRQGISGGSISSDGPKFSFDGETDIADLDTVNLYGVSFQGAGVIQLSGSTKTDVIGCLFTECDEIQPNDAEFLNNTIVSPVPRRGLEIVATHNIKLVTFVTGPTAAAPFDRVLQVDVSATPDTVVDETVDANSATTGDWLPFPATEAVGDYCAIGSRRQFERVTFDVGTAGLGGAVDWEYWSGSAWTQLTDEDHSLLDETGATVTFNLDGDISFRAPKDWAATSILDEDPLYYVRAVITTIYTTNPVLDTGSIKDPVQTLTNVPAEGTRTYQNLKFFGTPTADVENSANATLTDSYAFSNHNVSQSFQGTSGITKSGQSFTGDGGTLSHARFLFGITGSPTGNVVVKLYAHSGTFGSSSVPTGSAIATSNLFDIATFNDSFGPEFKVINFEFEDEVVLVNTTKYIIVVEYDDSDSSNYLKVGSHIPGAHAGNASFWTVGPSWTSLSSTDLTFAVHTDAIVKVSANQSDPTTEKITGNPLGAMTIENAVTVKVTAIQNSDAAAIENARVFLEATGGGDLPDGTEILNALSNASGIVQDTTFNFTTNQQVKGKVRRGTTSPLYKSQPLTGTITSSGYDVTAPMVDDE